jgi:hypothetical protein
MRRDGSTALECRRARPPPSHRRTDRSSWGRTRRTHGARRRTGPRPTRSRPGSPGAEPRRAPVLITNPYLSLCFAIKGTGYGRCRCSSEPCRAPVHPRWVALSCSKSATRCSVFEEAALDRAMDEAHAEREQEAAKAKVDISDCSRHPGRLLALGVSHSASVLCGVFCTGAQPLEGPCGRFWARAVLIEKHLWSGPPCGG